MTTTRIIRSVLRDARGIRRRGDPPPRPTSALPPGRRRRLRTVDTSSTPRGWLRGLGTRTPSVRLPGMEAVAIRSSPPTKAPVGLRTGAAHRIARPSLRRRPELARSFRERIGCDVVKIPADEYVVIPPDRGLLPGCASFLQVELGARRGCREMARGLVDEGDTSDETVARSPRRGRERPTVLERDHARPDPDKGRSPWKGHPGEKVSDGLRNRGGGAPTIQPSTPTSRSTSAWTLETRITGAVRGIRRESREREKRPAGTSREHPSDSTSAATAVRSRDPFSERRLFATVPGSAANPRPLGQREPPTTGEISSYVTSSMSSRLSTSGGLVDP